MSAENEESLQSGIELYIGYEHDGKGYKHQFRMKDGTVKTLYVTDEALLNIYLEGTMEELKGCVGQKGHPGEPGEVPCRKERGAILDEAKKIINGVRNDMYGKPEDNFELIARLWTLYLQKRYKKPDSFTGYLSKADVGIMMAYMKMARITSGHHMRDSFVDCAGYLAITADFGLIDEKEVSHD